MGGSCGRPNIVQAITQRAQRRLVQLAIRQDGSCALNSRRSCRQSDNGPAAQQPDQAGLVVAGQSAIVGCRSLGWGVQAEQLTRRPAERLGLLAPCSQKLPPVRDRLLPALGFDQIGASTLQGTEVRFVVRTAFCA